MGTDWVQIRWPAVASSTRGAEVPSPSLAGKRAGRGGFRGANHRDVLTFSELLFHMLGTTFPNPPKTPKFQFKFRLPPGPWIVERPSACFGSASRRLTHCCLCCSGWLPRRETRPGKDLVDFVVEATTQANPSKHWKQPQQQQQRYGRIVPRTGTPCRHHCIFVLILATRTRPPPPGVRPRRQ